MIYLERSIEENAVDEELKKLHSSVKRLKSSRKIGVKYMNMQEVMKYKIEEAVEEAVEKAVEEAVEKAVEEAVEKAVEKAVEDTSEKNMKLTKILLDAKRYDDLRNITQDKEYLKKMLAEFGID